MARMHGSMHGGRLDAVQDEALRRAPGRARPARPSPRRRSRAPPATAVRPAARRARPPPPRARRARGAQAARAPAPCAPAAARRGARRGRQASQCAPGTAGGLRGVGCGVRVTGAGYGVRGAGRGVWWGGVGRGRGRGRGARCGVWRGAQGVGQGGGAGRMARRRRTLGAASSRQRSSACSWLSTSCGGSLPSASTARIRTAASPSTSMAATLLSVRSAAAWYSCATVELSNGARLAVLGPPPPMPTPPSAGSCSIGVGGGCPAGADPLHDDTAPPLLRVRA